MPIVELTEPAVIEAYARRDPGLHVYELGDLDPAFWPRTRWWGLTRDQDLAALAVLYAGGDVPTLLAFGREPATATRALVGELRDRLPPRLHAHLSPGVVGALAPRFAPADGGERHLKMWLQAPRLLAGDAAGVQSPPADREIRRMTAAELPDLIDLYRRAYPHNWFDARMLATEQYFALVEDGCPVCVAGVHVYAPVLGVAAIGNVATALDRRGRGLAQRVMAHLCRSLRAHGIATIGLNVAAANAPAIRCYERLGFATVAEFDVFMLTARDAP